MNLIKDLKDTTDKVVDEIKLVYCEEYLKITFKDGDYVLFQGLAWGTDHDGEIDHITTLNHLNMTEQADLGIITEEEYQAYLKEEDEKRVKAKEEQERQQYEKLKKKFERGE